MLSGEGGGGSLHQLPVQPGDFLRQHGVFGLQRPFHRGEGADGSGGRGQRGRLPRRGHPHHRHQLQLPAGGNLPEKSVRRRISLADSDSQKIKENGNAYQPEEKTVKKTAVAWLGCLPCSSGSCCGYYFIRFLNIRR